MTKIIDKAEIHSTEKKKIAPAWQKTDLPFKDIVYEKWNRIAKITIHRPHVRNAFQPKTVEEMRHAFQDVQQDKNIGVVILTGSGDRAFCSGGDQKLRGTAGYTNEMGKDVLNVLELHREMRHLPKPIIAMVAGYAIGGGHVLHLVCDLTIAAENAIFGQTGPKVGSFDGGFGVTALSKIVGQKKAKEIWFLCKQYNAQEALCMGLINHVVPLENLEKETINWCDQILQRSPLAIQLLKAAFHAHGGGEEGLQVLSGHATMLYYRTEEAQEGRNAFLEKRPPNFLQFS